MCDVGCIEMMISGRLQNYVLFFFFNDTATTEIYTLSLHDALPIWRLRGRPRPGRGRARRPGAGLRGQRRDGDRRDDRPADRKSTRLNSSHANISYAVFCLKKKNIKKHTRS